MSFRTETQGLHLGPAFIKAWPIGVLALALLTPGCGRKSDAELPLSAGSGVATPQLEAAFATASAEAQQAARAAAEALRAKDYEKAVTALEVARSGPSVTLDQGLAIHATVVGLEAELIIAMNNGDARAKEAFQRLKSMKAK